MNKIALGTVQFGVNYGISNKEGQTTLPEVKKILNIAHQNNLDVIDTANAYGNSETTLGLTTLNDFKVVSKFINVNQPEDLINQFNKSLSLLKINKLYGYIAHRPYEALNNKNIWEELLILKKEGKVSKIGFSFNTIEEAEAVINKNIIPDLIQVPFNYFDNRFEKYMIYFKNEYNTEIHTRSTFLQGLFFLKPSELNSFFNPIKGLLLELQKQEYLSYQLLEYVVLNDFIDKVIIGVNNSEQLIYNLNYSKFNYPKLSKLNTEISNEILTPSLWKV